MTVHPGRMASSLCIAALTAAAAGDLIVSHWDGPDEGFWRVAENWDPIGWPYNQGGTEYEVHIMTGDAHVVIEEAQIFPINTLEVDFDNQLSLYAAAGLFIYEGSCINNGTIVIDNTGGGINAFIQFVGDGLLSGSGVVMMTEDLGNSISANGGSFTNASTHTIRGSGRIHGRPVINEGLIEANQPTALRLISDGSHPDDCNLGTIQAIDGGMLEIWDSWDNTDGLIQALNGSAVSLDQDDTMIIGGTLNTEGTGAIYGEHGAGLDGVTNTGTIEVSEMALAGSITNNGVINVGHPEVPTFGRLYVDAEEITIDGNGELVLANPDAGSSVYGDGAHSRLVNAFDHTTSGSGVIGGSIGINLTNHGSIVADASGGLTITVTDDLTNEGLIHVTGEGSFLVAEGPYAGDDLFTTSGTVLIDTGRTLTREDGDYVQTDGVTTIDGTLAVESGVVDLQGGVLAGTGLVESDVQNAGTVAPGSSTGELTIAGDYSQTSEGLLEIELAGTDPGEFDVITIDGDAVLDGKIWINRMNGFLPQIGDQFTVLTTTGLVSEQFVEVVPCPWIYLLSYEDHAVVIHVVNQVCAEDLNCDGWINTADLLLLLGNWGTDGYGSDIAEPIDIVNVNDLLGLLGMWGSCP